MRSPREFLSIATPVPLSCTNWLRCSGMKRRGWGTGNISCMRLMQPLQVLGSMSDWREQRTMRSMLRAAV